MSDPNNIGTTKLTDPDAVEWMDVQRGEMLQLVGLIEDQQTQLLYIEDTDKISVLLSVEDFETLKNDYMELLVKYETLKLDEIEERGREEGRQQFRDVHGIESPRPKDDDEQT